MKVKVNCTLIYGNKQKVLAGHVFEGKLEDFHEDIQALVNKGCPYIEVTKDPVKFVPPEPKKTGRPKKVEEEVKKEEPKKVVKKVAKPKKLVRKFKK